MNYTEYQEFVADDIKTCLESLGVQPILFFGSGMSQRYLNTPTWNGLLEKLVENCPNIEKSLAYYQQNHPDAISIGTEFSQHIREWAWENQDQFPAQLFDADQPSEIYIKYMVSQIFGNASSTNEAKKSLKKYKKEIEVLKSINPYAIITTNYDNFLEETFKDYVPVIGQEILRANYASIGEIIKIHGCSSKPDSIILTRSDYDYFASHKKYLSAKLLTFFAEHPLIILGYSAQDPNIRAILSDIDEILSPNNELIPNIYIVDWNSDAEKQGSHPIEKIIPIENDRSVRVKCITASNFLWIYEALAFNQAIDIVNPKLLRSVLARTFQLIRHDIPSKTIEVDFKILESATATEEEFAKLYGITRLDNATALNAKYPNTLSGIATELGFNYWHYANVLIKQIEKDTGTNIKTSDNNYHITVKVGAKSYTNKYSQACIELLQKVKDEEAYELEL